MKELLRLESEALELDSRFETIRRSLLVVGLSEAEIARVVESQEPLPALTVRAPLDGRVSGLHAVVGQVVQPGEEIFDIVDLGVVWVEGAFFESEGAHPALAWVMAVNPLTYGVGALRHSLYGSGVEGIPSMVTCLVVTVMFALGTFAMGTAVVLRRTARDAQ